MHGLWRGFAEHKESESKGGEELWGGGGGARCGGMCTHGEVLLQRVSKLHLQVDRKEVGVTVMEAERAHGQRDMET